jgi:rhodanese-related sulfurtransferase
LKKTLAVLALILTVGSAIAWRQPDDPPASSSPGLVNVVESAVMKHFAEMPNHGYLVNHNEFVAKVVAATPMLVVDIRQPDAYAKGHARGAINLPFGPVLAANLDRLPHSGEVFVYCYSGQSAGQTVMLLNALGVPARSVTYGWNLGISKAEGANAITVTEPSPLLSGQVYPTTPEVLAACRAYIERLASVAGSRFASNMVGEADAKALLDAPDIAVQFVSLQSAEDFAKGHIEGSMDIPWGSGMPALFSNLPKDKKLIVYCGSGQRAGQVVAGLRLVGFDAVSLRNGLGTPVNQPSGWVNQGFPLVQ